ncbi:UNVERIFIED_CONTAM: hypothetical protein FKN15_070764 [Acipenser sinensis]
MSRKKRKDHYGGLLDTHSDQRGHCRGLLDACSEGSELLDYKAVSLALDYRFGGTEPALILWQRLATRLRCPGKPLVQFTADVRYLARQGYDGFTAATKEELANEAFLRGLTPDTLRHHARLTTPTMLDVALSLAKLVKVVLGEQSLPSAHFKQPSCFSARRTQSPTATNTRTKPDAQTADDPDQPQEPEPLICWRCGWPGHIRHCCRASLTALPPTPQGNRP